MCGLTHPIELCHQMACSPGCECLDGFILSMKGKCIPEDDCLNENCGKNAIHVDKPCTTTCYDKFHGLPCLTEMVPGCECLPGYYMDSKGDCVELSECSSTDVVCGENESFSCATPCPVTCSDMYIITDDTRTDCDLVCTLRCDCNPGYVYNAEGKCVKPEQCNPDEVACPIAGQKYTNCSFLQTCRNMFDPQRTGTVCKPGCFCADNKVLDIETKQCVAHHECKESRKNMGCKRIDENMVYYPSHSACDATCDNPHPECDDEDIDGCFCKEEDPEENKPLFPATLVLVLVFCSLPKFLTISEFLLNSINDKPNIKI